MLLAEGRRRRAPRRATRTARHRQRVAPSGCARCVRQCTQRRGRVGSAGRAEPVAERAPASLELGVVGIDLMHLRRLGNRWRAAELEREIEALAHEQHAVGAGQYLGESTEARICDAAGAFHADDRDAARRLQRCRRLAHRPRHGARADEDQRSAGFVQRLHEGRGHVVGERHGLDRERPRIRRRRAGFAFERIGRQAQVNRPGPARGGDPDRPGDVARHLAGAGARPRGFAHRCGDVGLAHFLEGAASDLVVRRVARKQNDRRLGHLRGIERRHCVGVAGAAGDEGDADSTGDARPRVRHVHGARLMARVQEVDSRVEHRIEHRHHVVAGEREDALDPGDAQRSNQGVRAPAASTAAGRHGYFSSICSCLPSRS